MSNQAEGTRDPVCRGCCLLYKAKYPISKREYFINCILREFYFSSDETSKSSKVSELTPSWGVVTNLGEVTLVFVMSQMYSSTRFLKSGANQRTGVFADRLETHFY